MCKKIFNWLKKQFGQTSPATPEEQKQDVQTNIPSSPEGQNKVSTEAKSSVDAIGASTEEILRRVKNIEKYLRLEEVAMQSNYIDFSFVKDEKIRHKLIADHIEMWRCRYGTSRHQQDFRLFCLYVHMQVESLLMYYRRKKYLNEKDEIADVKKKWSEYDRKSLDAKGLLILFYPKSSNDKDIFDTIRVIRNNSVHPNVNSIISEDDDYKAKQFLKDKDIHLHYFCGIQTTVDAKMKTREEYRKIKEIENDIEKKESEDVETLKIQKRVCESSAEKRLSLWNNEIKLNISDYNTHLRIQHLLTNTPYDYIIKALYQMSKDIESKLSNAK